jgi:hypothetical protein
MAGTVAGYRNRRECSLPQHPLLAAESLLDVIRRADWLLGHRRDPDTRAQAVVALRTATDRLVVEAERLRRMAHGRKYSPMQEEG